MLGNSERFNHILFYSKRSDYNPVILPSIIYQDVGVNGLKHNLNFRVQMTAIPICNGFK